MMNYLPSCRRATAIFVGMMLYIATGGCTRTPLPEYVLSKETSELPAPHQEQIRALLQEYFGNPLTPRLAAAAEEAEEADDSEEEADPELVELVDRRLLARGAEVYRMRCAGCHGVTGDGNGEAAAYLQPKPRDYRQGTFKFTSTGYGQKPTRADLVRTIRRGAKGTSMPAFPWLAEEDMQAVIDYIISLSQRGETERFCATIAQEYEEDEPIEDFDLLDALQTTQSRWQDVESQAVRPVTAPPAYDDDSIIAGRAAFLAKGCVQCHGQDGEGQTEWLSHEFLAQQEALPADQRVQINYDAWKQPAPAADLTARMLHGGRRPLDIYRRIYTGINGTPMPAFGSSLAAEPETIWHLVHYVMSIVDGREVDFPEMPTDQSATSAGPNDANLDGSGN